MFSGPADLFCREKLVFCISDDDDVTDAEEMSESEHERD